MTDALQIRVKGKGNVVGTVSVSRDTDPLEVATIFGKEHSLQAAAILRLAKRIKTQADLVWKLREERDHNNNNTEHQRVQWSAAESEDSEFDNTNKDDESVMKIRIRRRDGIFGTINFRTGDDPSVVAARFGVEHNLPSDSVARLATKIKAQCEQGASIPRAMSISSMNNDAEGASETKRGESPNTYNRRNSRSSQDVGGGGVGVRRTIGGDFDDYEDERQAEEMYRLARLRTSEPTDTLDDAIAMDSDEWHLTTERSPRRLSSGGVQSHLTVPSPGIRHSGSSSGEDRGLGFLGREDEEANEHSEKGSSIADVHAERERAWAQARAAAKRLESSLSQSVNDTDVGGIGPTRNASSRSLSPWLERQQQLQATAVAGGTSSRSRKQQQLVSERLHAQAKRIADRKAALKVRVEKDRVDEIVRSRSLSPLPSRGGGTSSSSHKHGARSSSAGSRQSSSKGRSVPEGQSFHEALYYNDIKWRQSRGKALEAQAAERARQLAAEEAKTMTFKPKLSTSKEKQRAVAGRRQMQSTSPRGRSPKKQNRVDVFSYLHRTKVQSEARLREKALQIRREEDVENVFRPTINPISERLSRRLRMERGGHMTELPSNALRRRLRLGDSRSPVRDNTSSDKPRPPLVSGGKNREAGLIDADDDDVGTGSGSTGQQSSAADGTTAGQTEVLGISSIPSDGTTVGADHDVTNNNNNNNNNNLGRAGATTTRRSTSVGDRRGRVHRGVVEAGYLSGTRNQGRSLSEGPRLPRGRSKERSDYSGLRQRSTSPYSTSYTVFDSLYDSRLDHAAFLWQSRVMHLRNVDRSSPHKPNIGVNTFYPVEEDRKAFFQRMCDAGSKRDLQHVVLRQQLLQKVQEEERGGKPVSTLTAAAEKQLIHRLTVEAPKQHQEELKMLEKEAEEDLRRLRREGRDRRMGHRSMHLATQHQRRALSEVFDVLLATVLYTKHTERKRRQLLVQQNYASTTNINSNDSSFSVDLDNHDENQQTSNSDDNASSLPPISNYLPTELSIALTEIQTLQKRDPKQKIPPESQFANSPVRRIQFPLGPKTSSPRDSLLSRAKLSREPSSSNSNSSNSNVSLSDNSFAAALGGVDGGINSSHNTVTVAEPPVESVTIQTNSARDHEGHVAGVMSTVVADRSSSTRLKMKVTMSIAPTTEGDSNNSLSLPATQRKVHLQTVHTFMAAGDDTLSPPDEDGLSMGGLVDLRLAVPSLLQPRAMAFAVTIVLRAAQEDRVQLVSEGLLPADSTEAYMLSREEFVLRMERLIDQGEAPPIRDSLKGKDPHGFVNDHRGGVGGEGIVGFTTSSIDSNSVLAPALSLAAYTEMQRNVPTFKTPHMIDEEIAARERERIRQARLRTEELLKERSVREPSFAMRSSGEMLLEDYLIRSRDESENLKKSLKEAWDGEVYRECTFRPFTQSTSSRSPSPLPLPRRSENSDEIPSSSSGSQRRKELTSDEYRALGPSYFSRETVSAAAKRRNSSASRSSLSIGASTPFAAAFALTKSFSPPPPPTMSRRPLQSSASSSSSKDRRRPTSNGRSSSSSAATVGRKTTSTNTSTTKPLSQPSSAAAGSTIRSSSSTTRISRRGGEGGSQPQGGLGYSARHLTKMMGSMKPPPVVDKRMGFGTKKETFVFLDAHEQEEKQRQRFSVALFKIKKGYYH